MMRLSPSRKFLGFFCSISNEYLNLNQYYLKRCNFFLSSPTLVSSSDSRDYREKVLKLRSKQRGLKELDLILSRYADEKLSGMTEEQLRTYEKLISIETPELVLWLLGQVEPPLEWKNNQVFISIKQFSTNFTSID